MIPQVLNASLWLCCFQQRRDLPRKAPEKTTCRVDHCFVNLIL
jgi:hypothetical protein